MVNKYTLFKFDFNFDFIWPEVLAIIHKFPRGCCGRNHMVVGFTTTYAINAYRH